MRYFMVHIFVFVMFCRCLQQNHVVLAFSVKLLVLLQTTIILLLLKVGRWVEIIQIFYIPAES